MKLIDKSKKELVSIIAKSKSNICVKCGEKASVVINATRDNVKVRKICSLCDNCYSDLLDNLGIIDRL
jgi:hypothetical protein